jgi:hypothetical protein
MLPAVGAASLALDAIQSLTSPAPSSSSQPAGIFGPALSDIADSSQASSADSTIVSGFSGTQISSDNISALLDAQSLTSANFANALDAGTSTSDSSQSQPASVSGAASSAYSAIDQLTQSTAIPLGLNPFSVSV